MVIGSGLAGAASYMGQSAANAGNVRAAQHTMSFQKEMSNTAHQRQVQDLRQAGLNPILSANSGAQVPAGATPHMENALGAGVTSAIDAARMRKEVEQVESQIGVNESIKAVQAQTAIKEAATAKNIAKQTQLLEKTMPNIIQKSQLEGKQAGEDMKYMNIDNLNRRIQNGLNSVNTAKQIITPTVRLKTGDEVHPDVKTPEWRTKP